MGEIRRIREIHSTYPILVRQSSSSDRLHRHGAPLRGLGEPEGTAEARVAVPHGMLLRRRLVHGQSMQHIQPLPPLSRSSGLSARILKGVRCDPEAYKAQGGDNQHVSGYARVRVDLSDVAGVQ